MFTTALLYLLNNSGDDLPKQKKSFKNQLS